MPSETNPPLVSVVVAAYNMGQYLESAVRSILAQSHSRVEVHIVNDGSTDTTATVADALAADPRVHVHHQQNQGQARAKNRGIGESRGDYVGFLDADDTWLTDKLERQLPLFAANKAVGVVYSDYECMDAEGKPVPKGFTQKHRGRVSGALLIDNFVPFPSALVRRECFEKFGMFDEEIGMGIDYDLWLRLSAHYAFEFVDAPTVRYRIWGGQMSKNYRKRYECAIRIMQRFLDAHADVVAGATVKTAWAHTYLGRGNSILWNEKDKRAARADYVRALKHRPGYWPAWRAILRSVVSVNAPEG